MRGRYACRRIYRGHRLDFGYRMDFMIADQLILELEAVDKLLPIRDAPVMTGLKLARLPLALLPSFKTILLKQGLCRFALSDLAALAPAVPLRSVCLSVLTAWVDQSRLTTPPRVAIVRRGDRLGAGRTDEWLRPNCLKRSAPSSARAGC